MKCNMKRKGFTLVELLIVIVVIGILSAMMMLSSTEAVTSAQASNIISNLRNLKTAALAMYVDKLDYAGNLADGNCTGGTSTGSFDTVIKYLNTGNGASNTSYNGYGVVKSSNEWYVYYNVTDTRVQEKLVGRAKSVGLCGGGSTALKSTDVYAKGDAYVGMWVVKP